MLKTSPARILTSPILKAPLTQVLLAAFSLCTTAIQPLGSARASDATPDAATASTEAPESFGKMYRCKPGPWGDLEYYYIYLEAPDRIVEDFTRPDPTPKWHFPGGSELQLRALFETAGLPPALQNYLLDPEHHVVEDDVMTLFPPVPDVLAMTPSQRSIIYAELAKSQLNMLHVYPACIFHGDLDSWLAQSKLRPELQEAIKKTTYLRGEMLCFSDVAAILGMVESEKEAHELMKTMSRTRSLVLQLNVRSRSDLEQAVRYWSANQHNEEIASIIFPPVSDGGGVERLDCVHLLPSLARRYLYTYPSADLALSARMPDCYWTAMNFFSSSPLNFHTDERMFVQHLTENYISVEPPYIFGDVLIFLAPDGTNRHSCVYIADDIVYTKNGQNRGSPWLLSKINDVHRLYSYDQQTNVVAFRRKPDPDQSGQGSPP
jgi:hypothetical protein